MLLQKRNGSDVAARRRPIACDDMGTGRVSMWMVPERSMSSALITGRFTIVLCFQVGKRDGRLLWRDVRGRRDVHRQPVQWLTVVDRFE